MGTRFEPAKPSKPYCVFSEHIDIKRVGMEGLACIHLLKVNAGRRLQERFEQNCDVK